MVETYWYSRDAGGLKQGDSHGKEQFVTHADYKTLVEKYELVCKFAEERCDEINRLTAELAECRKDAERYRDGWFAGVEDADGNELVTLRADDPRLAQPKPEQAVGYGVDFNIPEKSRAALLWLLWHHQGGSSPVGQPIRRILGIGPHERMSDEYLAVAKAFAASLATPRPAPVEVGDGAYMASFQRCVEALRELRIAFPDVGRAVYREATEALAQADTLPNPRPAVATTGDGVTDECGACAGMGKVCIYTGEWEACGSCEGTGKSALASRPVEAAQGGVPEGWKLVPEELTEEMREAITDAIQEEQHVQVVWDVGLDAAPEVPHG